MILRKQDMMNALMDAFYSYSIVNERRMKLHKNDLGFQSSIFLVHLYQMRQPRTPSQLREYFMLKPSALSNQISRLLEAGYVNRIDHPASNKQRWIVLTAEGELVAKGCYEAVQASTSEVLEIFKPKQQYLLVQLVEIYTRLIRGHVLAYREAHWSKFDTFIYQYYQLYYGIEWAMMTKNEIPISFKESRVLRAISDLQNEHQNTVQSIAKALYVSVNDASEMITRMEKRGIIRKLIDNEDHRKVYVEMSPATTEAINQFINYQGQWVDERVTKPNIRELVQFFIVINKFTQYYKRQTL
jgi:DNA-binding MarR family transcriptional regulator